MSQIKVGNKPGMLSLKLLETDATNPKGMFSREEKPVYISKGSHVKYVLVWLENSSLLMLIWTV